jgi:hypothetical protein
MGGILQLVMSLLMGYPPLDNLAQNAATGRRPQNLMG